MQQALLIPPEPPRRVPSSAPSLEDRLRSLHNYIYANEGIKQYARVMDEVAKVLYTKLAADQRGDDRLYDASEDQLPALMRTIFDSVKQGEHHAFDAGEQLLLSDDALGFAFRQLGRQPIRVQDPKGAAFQAILGPTLRSELGQFFTPDPLKQLLIALTCPRSGEVVGDPASGTAGLLLDVVRNVPESVVRAAEVDAVLARLARLNLYLAGAHAAEVVRIDSLQPLSELSAATSGRLGRDAFDVIVTNPPFGSKGKVSDPDILRDLPVTASGKRSVAPEILFVERIVQMLKPGGRAGIVLPSGLLSNSSAAGLRSYLRAQGRIYATVALPVETFQPTGNSVNAALMFFERSPGSAKAPYPVFRAISGSVGYDHRGRPSAQEADAPAIAQAWSAFAEEYGEVYRWAR